MSLQSPHIYILGPGSTSHWPDQGSMGSSTYYPTLYQKPSTTSAGPYSSGAYFGNGHFDDGNYESEYDVISAIHSSSTSTMSSLSANTVICTVLGLGKTEDEIMVGSGQPWLELDEDNGSNSTTSKKTPFEQSLTVSRGVWWCWPLVTRARAKISIINLGVNRTKFSILDPRTYPLAHT